MGLFDSMFGGLYDLFGPKPGKEYSGYFKDLAGKFGNLAESGYGGLNPNLTAEQMPFDTESRAAELGTMDKLGAIVDQGGLDAEGRANIAEANQSTATAAKRQSDLIQAKAGSGANRNTGVTLSLEEQAGQDAADTGAQVGLGVAGAADTRRRAALSNLGQLALGTGSQMNAVNQFNTGLRQATNTGNFQRAMSRLGGMGEAYQGEGDMYGRGYGAARGDQTQMGRGFSSIGGSMDEIMKRIGSMGGG